MTEKRTSRAASKALIIGDPDDEFVRRAVRVLGESHVEFAFCDSVYAAVGELAKRQWANILVIGRLGEMAMERGRFFRIAAERGLACCCLADGDLGRRRSRILDALESGAFIINQPAEVKDVLMQLSAEGADCPCKVEENASRSRGIERVVTTFIGHAKARTPGRNQNGRALISHDFVTTKDELDALLGA
jgi:hypothetical protein